MDRIDEAYANSLSEKADKAKNPAEKLKVFLVATKEIFQSQEKSLKAHLQLLQSDPSKCVANFIEDNPQFKYPAELSPQGTDKSAEAKNVKFDAERTKVFLEQVAYFTLFESEVGLKQISICFSLVDTHTKYSQRLYNEIKDRFDEDKNTVVKQLATITKVEEFINSLKSSKTDAENEKKCLM